MIRPRLPKVANGTRLTTDLVNGIINRTEYAADLLRQYKLIAGTEMYVEPHYDGTRVSYFYPVGGGATPKGSPITIPPPVGNIELEEGVIYTIPAEGEVGPGQIPPFQPDGTPTVFTISQIAYSRGLFVGGGLWQYYNLEYGNWRGLLDTGVITPFRLSFMGGFRALTGKSSFGQPYWTGGFIYVL